MVGLPLRNAVIPLVSWRLLAARHEVHSTQYIYCIRCRARAVRNKQVAFFQALAV